MRDTIYIFRHIARIVIEMESPIAISSGRDNIMTDSSIMKDINGLPYIPGTSITGVIRNNINFLNSNEKDKLFGFQTQQSGQGSKIIISDAIMIGNDGKPKDGIQSIDFTNEFYKKFQALPIRQHVCINDKGVNKGTGKFDEEIVYKGTRFCFEIELMSQTDNRELFGKIMDTICSDYLRIGSGTRKGFGKASVITEQSGIAHLNLKEPKDLELYLKKTTNLSDSWIGFNVFDGKQKDDNCWETYSINIHPIDFFLFSSGFKDDDADMSPVYEEYITWSQNNKPKFTEQKNILIPASSIKGALSHRVAYYWNKLNKKYADNKEGLCGSSNPAVFALFGGAEENSRRGNVIISDIYGPNLMTKIHSHVKIDRFTGGTIKSGLFFEKTVYGRNNDFELKIIVNKAAYIDKTIEESLKLAIEDLRNGRLPLGGGVNRGNGIFIEQK